MFEEDLEIFVVLAEGVFYQMSYDGTEVAIITDYPGLLLASHVSDPNTSYSKRDLSFLLTHHAVLYSKGEGFGAPYYSKGTSEESVPHSGRAFQEESKRRYGHALIEEV